MFTHASKSSGCFSSGDLPLSTGTICPTQSPINDRQGLGCWGKSTMLILKYKFWSPKSLPWDMFHTNFSPLASFKYITHQLLGTCVEYCQYPAWIRQTWRSRWRGWSRRQTWRTSQLQAGIRPGLPAVVVDCPSQLICVLDLHLLSKRWRLHTWGCKMFKLLFHAGMDILNHFFCRISMSSECKEELEAKNWRMGVENIPK